MRTVERSRRGCRIAPSHQNHTPTAICVIDVNAIATSARTILQRMAGHESDRGCGHYLFVEPNGTAYVIADGHTCAQDWIRDKFVWMVGFYTRTHTVNRGLPPLLDGIIEDVLDHLQSATQGRECLGLQQTGEANSLQSATDACPLGRLDGSGVVIASGGGRSHSGEGR